MSLSSIVSVTISTTGAGVTQRGFGTPLIVARISSTWSGVQTFTSLSGLATALTTAGISAPTAHPVYLAAQTMLSQFPRVINFKVANFTTVPGRVLKITPVRATTGDVYTAVVTDYAGVTGTATFTVASTQTVAAVCTGLSAAITGLASSLVLGADHTTYLDIEGAAGVDYFYAQISLVKADGTPGVPGTDFIITEDTAAIAQDTTDLATIRTLDDDWYWGIFPDRRSSPQIVALQAAIESAEKLAVYDTCDTRCIVSGVSGSPMYDLKAATRSRCLAFYSGDDNGYLGAGVVGRMAPLKPGSATFAFKAISGPSADVLTDTQTGFIEAQNGCYYSATLGVNMTNGGLYGGRSPAGTYIDIVWGRDKLKARIEENIVQLLVDNNKIPFTQGGVDLVCAQVRQPLLEGIRDGYIASDPAPTVTGPDVTTVSAVNKANRTLPDVVFVATISGAVQSVQITGSLEV
jgi:hypothetical protein